MKTSIVNVKVDPKVKKEAQEVADKLGFTLSGLVSGYLKHLIKTKEVVFNTSAEPTEYLLAALEESREDIKEGRVISFETWKQEKSFLNKLIADDKKHKKS